MQQSQHGFYSLLGLELRAREWLQQHCYCSDYIVNTFKFYSERGATFFSRVQTHTMPRMPAWKF